MGFPTGLPSANLVLVTKSGARGIRNPRSG
jgi:hypothetical protein